MAEYHVGCGITGIFAGTLNANKTRWRAKSDVTMEAMDSVAEYMIMNDKEFRFTRKGERYVLRVLPYKEEQDG